MGKSEGAVAIALKQAGEVFLRAHLAELQLSEEKVALLNIFPLKRALATVTKDPVCPVLNKKSFKQAKLKIIPVR